MACTNCKKKKETTEEMLSSVGETPNWIIWAFFGGLIFSVYGIFSFIFDLIDIFL